MKIQLLLQAIVVFRIAALFLKSSTNGLELNSSFVFTKVRIYIVFNWSFM